jgi:hypothetical protein
MSVRIERTDKDGARWAVSGNNQAELELGIAALQSALNKADEGRQSKKPGRQPKNPAAQTDKRQTERLQQAIQVLRAISEAPGGADSAALTAALGWDANKNRGIGSIMSMVGRLLNDIGIPANTVFNSSGRPGDKRWFQEAAIARAIKELEQRQEDESLG